MELKDAIVHAEHAKANDIQSTSGKALIAMLAHIQKLQGGCVMGRTYRGRDDVMHIVFTQEGYHLPDNTPLFAGLVSPQVTDEQIVERTKKYCVFDEATREYDPLRYEILEDFINMVRALLSAPPTEEACPCLPDSLGSSIGDYIEYLITIGKGGSHGVMPLLKTPADHEMWEANMRWFALALVTELAQPADHVRGVTEMVVEAKPVAADLETVAWLIEGYDRNDKLHKRVVLSPLTDHLDESAEAIPLCKIEDAKAMLAAAPQQPIRHVVQICNAYESGVANGQQPGGPDLSRTPHDDQELAAAYQLGCLAGVERAQQPAPLKDHQIAQTVNAVRDIAVKFHGHQSLRERIAEVLVPALQQPAPAVGADAESKIIEFADAHARIVENAYAGYMGEQMDHGAAYVIAEEMGRAAIALQAGEQ